MNQTKRALFLECFSGISGDMTVAALLDLGADEKLLKETLATLDLTDYEINISRAKKSGLDVCDFSVILNQDNHDHDMDYLHGHEHGQEHDHEHEHSHEHEHEHEHSHEHEHEHDHEHSHEHEHEHSHEHEHEHSHEHEHEHSHEHDHEHSHEHEHEHSHNHVHEHSHQHDQNHHHAHEHRGLLEVRTVLRSGKLTENALAIAERIFDVIADAEAAAHGVPKNEVHFHEVGAVDSIVDIAAIAICLDNLGYQEIFVPVLYEGQGTIRCQHGIIPVPVPAVSHIAGSHGLRLHRTEVFGELVTPTGAAVAAAVRTGDRLPEEYTIKKTGLGGGKRNYPGVPGFLRAIEIEYTEKVSAARADTDYIWKLESNIDDCSPEVLGYCMERLLAAGARDVHYIPVFMKKNRPAYELSVICSEADLETMENIIFMETTTIGIRKQRMERSVLKRSIKTVDTPYGEIKVKCVILGDMEKCYPEYESVKQAAMKCAVPFSAVFDAAKKAVIM